MTFAQLNFLEITQGQLRKGSSIDMMKWIEGFPMEYCHLQGRWFINFLGHFEILASVIWFVGGSIICIV